MTTQGGQRRKAEKHHHQKGHKHPYLAAKPVYYFRRKERELQGQKKVLTKQTTIPAKAQQASYEVAYLIAQAKNVVENLI